MTFQEHQLIVGMFARQLHIIKALTESLKSYGVLEEGDLKAFMAASVTFAGTADDLIDAAERMYREIATPLGIHLPSKLFGEPPGHS